MEAQIHSWRPASAAEQSGESWRGNPGPLHLVIGARPHNLTAHELRDACRAHPPDAPTVSRQAQRPLCALVSSRMLPEADLTRAR